MVAVCGGIERRLWCESAVLHMSYLIQLCFFRLNETCNTFMLLSYNWIPNNIDIHCEYFFKHQNIV